MRLRVLGCSGGELPGFNTTSFLIDECLAIDAGAICLALSAGEQQAVRRIFVTHPHLDHVKGIALLADNLSMAESDTAVEVVATPEIVAALRAHLFNDVLWPDFTKIPSAEAPVMAFRELRPLVAERFGEYTVTACPVHHTVPAVGYLVAKGRNALLFSGDTGPTDHLWELTGRVDALVVDVSFPNAQEELALASGHLTARLLGMELRKAAAIPRRILITHAKPPYLETIARELAELPFAGITLLRDGDTFAF